MSDIERMFNSEEWRYEWSKQDADGAYTEENELVALPFSKLPRPLQMFIFKKQKSEGLTLYAKDHEGLIEPIYYKVDENGTPTHEFEDTLKDAIFFHLKSLDEAVAKIKSHFYSQREKDIKEGVSFDYTVYPPSRVIIYEVDGGYHLELYTRAAMRNGGTRIICEEGYDLPYAAKDILS